MDSSYIFDLRILAISFVVFSVKELRYLQLFREVIKNQAKNQFFFKSSIWGPIAPIFPLALLIQTAGNENYTAVISLSLIVVLVITLRLYTNKIIYTITGDSIESSVKNSIIIATKVNGITITSEEINFHTAQYMNHHTFKATKLTGKSWLEFQQAAEEFAVQHEHIKIEKV